MDYLKTESFHSNAILKLAQRATEVNRSYKRRVQKLRCRQTRNKAEHGSIRERCANSGGTFRNVKILFMRKEYAVINW